MREIQFHGKREDNGEWVYGSFLKMEVGGNPVFCIIPCAPLVKSIIKGDGIYQVDPSTVGQYTGLTDKNGVKIFDGDIVRITLPLPSQDPIVELSSVDFDNGCFIVTWGGSRATFDSFVGDTTFEVIGNVHDNPEILEVKK